jgi:hypothetical protein
MPAPISPGRLQNAAHYYASYAVVLPFGLSFEDALKPEFWAHCAPKLRQHDLIRLIPEEGTYFAELLVLSSGRGFVNVKTLRHVSLGAEDLDASNVSDLVEVKWRGPHSKWSIVRNSDSTVLKEGIVEKADALREAAGYAKAA